MCGIAGYSLDAESRVDRTLAAQALLAGIAERGADAVGYAHRVAPRRVTIHKQRTGATALLDADRAACRHDRRPRSRARLHEGPSDAAREQPPDPPRLGRRDPQRVIVNDEEIFARHGIEHAEPGMTVDSEAIFALVAAARSRSRRSRGASRLDGVGLDRRADCRRAHLARGVARPLWIGRARRELFFASTKAALEVVEGTLRLTLRKHEVAEGRLLHIARADHGRDSAFAPIRTLPRRHAAPRRCATPHRGCLLPRQARRRCTA